MESSLIDGEDAFYSTAFSTPNLSSIDEAIDKIDTAKRLQLDLNFDSSEECISLLEEAQSTMQNLKRTIQSDMKAFEIKVKQQCEELKVR
jgi:hypothetical protein